MQSDRARERLELIRTLMERSAVYRRALAPMTLTAGAAGVAAGLFGLLRPPMPAPVFLGFWLAVGAVVAVAVLLQVRRQALRDREPFWSPPTRRVVRAVLPPFLAGVVLGVLGVLRPEAVGQFGATAWVPCLWVILYGCGLHSAAFFMPRGMRLFGSILVALGSAFLAFGWLARPGSAYGHLVMGVNFGLLHLAYGVYLRVTEKRTPAA